jgi:hypothetical protein
MAKSIAEAVAERTVHQRYRNSEEGATKKYAAAYRSPLEESAKTAPRSPSSLSLSVR